MNILEKIKDVITSIILIFISIFFLLMYMSGNMTFRIEDYDKKEDRPSINELEILISPILKNLPKPYTLSNYSKKEVVSINISYEKLEIKQKSKILKIIENQKKWQWLKNNKNGSFYCYNQFALNVYENDRYRNDDYINFLSISVSWSQYDDICRSSYYKKMLKSN